MNKKYIYKGIAMLALLAVTASCEKDTLPTNFAPDVVTGGTEEIYRTGVRYVKGTVTNPDNFIVEEYGIQYSLYDNFAVPTQVASTNMDSKGNFSVALEGLEAGTKFYYRTYAFGGYNTVYGLKREFSTVTTSAPTFGDNTVSNVGLTSFNISTILLDEGGNALQMSAFIYKQVADENDKDLSMSTKDVTIVPVDNFDGVTTINELFTGTLYAIRPCAISGSGIGLGDITYVKTEKTDQTMLSLCTLSDSTTSSIAVEALVLSLGTHPIIETGFCYSSENKNPTVENLTVVAQLDGNTIRKSTLTNLNSNTTYYIRAYAKSEDNSYAYSEKAVEYKVLEHKVLEVSTLSADEVSTISARLMGNVRDNNVAIRERGFCYSTTETNPTVENATRLVVNTDQFQYSTVIDVTYNTPYYYCAYAVNEEGAIFYGETLSFTSDDINLPIVRLADVLEYTATEATMQTTVALNYIFKSHTVKVGILLSDSDTEPTLESTGSHVYGELLFDSHLTVAEVSQQFDAKFELEPDTKYYYRAYAENEKGLVYSEVKSFTSKKRTPASGDVNYPEVKP